MICAHLEAGCRDAEVHEPEIQPAVPPAQQVNGHAHHAEQNGSAAHHDIEDSANESTSRHSVSIELGRLRKQLEVAEGERDQAELELKELRAALASERDRAFRAEVQVSELQSKLQLMDELERELEKYKEAVAEKSKKGGGLWGYISGA